MALKLYDTLTRSVRDFEPADPPGVRLYACGPTVYDHAHIGNYRSFVVYDPTPPLPEVGRLRRGLRHEPHGCGRQDNRSCVRGRKGRAGVQRLHSPRTSWPTREPLGILPARSYPLATGYIPQMVSWIERLEEKGLAYSAEGRVGLFLNRCVSRLWPPQGPGPRIHQPGARVQDDEYEKENVRDFALWKATKPADEAWAPPGTLPWGRGRPAGIWSAR